MPTAKGKQEYIVSFAMPELNKGQYVVTVAVADGYQEDHVQLCWLNDALVFRIPDRKYDIPGMLYLENGTVETFQLS